MFNMDESARPFNIMLKSSRGYHIKSAHVYHSNNLDKISILNLDKHKETNQNLNNAYYSQFKNFVDLVVDKLSKEVHDNTGDIIQFHLFEEETLAEEDKAKFMEMFEHYKTTYSVIDKKTEKDKFTTQEGKIYPLFMEDLDSKSSSIYENFEKEHGITIKIEDQTDEEFLKTLGKRVDGLETCLKTSLETSIIKKDKKYYEDEYIRESTIYDENEKNPKSNEKKIDEQCKTIYYSGKTQTISEKHKTDSVTLTNTLSNIETLFKSVEREYAKTFLPEYCWDNTNQTWNMIAIRNLIVSDNKDFKQYIFGNSKDTDFARKVMPLLYMVGGMMSAPENTSCHPLVNWSIFLNTLYTKCSTYNKIPKCFARFLLPVLEKTLTESDINPFDNPDIIPKQNKNTREIYEFKKEKQIINLFNDNPPDKNAKFIGIISIKYYYQNHGLNEYRIWYLYIFKNNDLTSKINRQDIITGVREYFFCVSQTLHYINKGGIYDRDAITYIELLYFEKLAKNGKIFLYKTKYNPTTLFLSLYNNLDSNSENIFLKDLDLNKVELYILPYVDKKKILILDYHKDTVENMNGGFKKLKYKIQSYNNENNLYINKNIISEYVVKFKLLTKKIDDIEKSLISKSITYLYNYLLVFYDESQIYLKNKLNRNIISITKYKPIGYTFYHINELLYKYNIFKNFEYNNDSILTIGTNLSFIEVIKFNNYKVKNIKNILTLKQTIFELYKEQLYTYIKNIEHIYNIENIEFNETIYNLININFNNTNNNYYKIIFYNVHIRNKGVDKYENYFNLPSRFVGILFMLKNLKLGGTFIFNINYLEYKFEADMIIIISKYFEKYDLFKPEIHNEYKRSGVVAIFENFKGIDEHDYLDLLKILDTIKKVYPDEGKEFNIYDKDIREELHITKPIVKIPDVIPKQIIGFLDTNINDKIYDKIKEFTEEINFKKCLFIQKMINILSSTEQIKIMNNTKLPTPDQIISSITYCRKYNIPFNDKYTKDKLNNVTSKIILNDMYGLQQPILHKFKTPFQTYIVNKIVLNPKFKLKASNKSTTSIFKTIYSHSKRGKSNINKKYKSKTRTTKNRTTKTRTTNLFFNDLFSSNISKKSSRKSCKSCKSCKSQPKTLFSRTDLSLDKALFNSNNSIVQVGRMIDSRKDFTKANPNEDYDNFKEKFRYYRSKGKDKQNNLNIIVQKILGDYSISQAWLKMYEIIVECDIVPVNKLGIFRSFHFCEAPGTFINCLNNYIYTKTKFNNFEWLAQSLHPRIAKIKDEYGIIKRHPKNWDWGADKTGDISNPDNIKYYSKIIKLFNMNNTTNMTNMNIPFLITSDAGLEPEDPKYPLVAYSSYLAILYSIPINGIMVYKIKDTPLDIPLIWNLIFITYTNFKEMYFFKPIQNSQSREFYIIAKGYLGTIDQNILDYLLMQIDNFDKKTFQQPDTDLFNDMYPEEFIVQLSNIYDKLASNYCNSIERILFYVDNKELLGEDYIKHIKNYVQEKNEEWIKKYKIRRLEKNKIL